MFIEKRETLYNYRRINLSGKYTYYKYMNPTTELKVCETKMDRIKGEMTVQ